MKLTAKPGIKLNTMSDGYYECLPDGYDLSKKYPLYIFLHGQGETGNGTITDLAKLLNNAPMTYLKNGKWNPQAIVIAPQTSNDPKRTGPGYAYHATQTLDGLLAAKYAIDTTRVYLLALSMGGVTGWDLARGMAIKRFAGMAVAAGAWDSGSSPISTASIFRDEKFPVWVLHNQGDPTVSVNNANTWITAINQPTAKKTIFPVSGHDAWTKAFDPDYREDGKNVYEWLAQFTTTRGVTAPPVQPTPVYKNAEKKGNFKRNDCGGEFTGSEVEYTVQAGRFTATTQAEADRLAAEAWLKEGQPYANTNGTCTPIPKPPVVVPPVVTPERKVSCVITVYTDGSIEIV